MHIHTHAIHSSCTTVSLHHKGPVKVRDTKYMCTLVPYTVHYTHAPSGPSKGEGLKYTCTHMQYITYMHH